MYLKKHPFRTKNCLFLALILVMVACEERSVPLPTLHAGLKTHFQLIQSGKTGSARVQLRQLMEHEQIDAQPLFLMGLSYHKEKKYTKAVEWFEKSTTFKKESERYPQSWHFLGWSYYYLGDVEKSKVAFEKFLDFQPNEGDSIFGLGLIEMDSGNNSKAQELFRASIVALGDHPKGQAKAKARLGDALASAGDVYVARELYLEALILDPDLYEAWYRLANTYRNEDQSLFQDYLVKSREAQERTRQGSHQTRFPE